MSLTPAEFVAHWSDSTRNEIQGYQSHFIPLCLLVGFDPDVPAILTSPAGDEELLSRLLAEDLRRTAN